MRFLATLKPEVYEKNTYSFGVVAEIDWDQKRVVRQLKVPAAYFHDTTAFMAPLVEGVATLGNRVFVTGWNFVIEIDYETFDIVNVVSNRLMADLHSAATDGTDIFVISTAIDALLCLDGRTLDLKWRWGPDEPILNARIPDSIVDKKVHARVASFFQRLRGDTANRSTEPPFIEREFRYLHKSRTYHSNRHLNGVYCHQGLLYLTTKGWFDVNSSAVIQLDPASRDASFFCEPGSFRGMHDGVFLDGRFYVTESAENGVAWREPDGAIGRKRLTPEPYFMRGLLYTGNTFLVGMSTLRNAASPAMIVEYDRDFGHELGRMDVSSFYPTGHGTNIHTLAASPEV